MSYVFESLDDFLFEELGSLKKFNLPKELLSKVIKSPGESNSAGRDSIVDVIGSPKDYQKLLKDLKPEFVAGIISVDGITKYLFYRSSERKFGVHDIEVARRKESEKKKKDEERRRREMQDREISEGRSGRGYSYYDPSNMGELSTQTLSDFIKKIEGDVTIELIRPDTERSRKKTQRWESKRIEDPLEDSGRTSGYTSSASTSQKRRYEKYASKKRIEIDKKIDSVKEELKEQILNNFDKAMDKILDDLRKGYSWYSDPKEISSAIIKGVDFSKLKHLAAAYDAVEPGGDKKDSIFKAVNTMKKLGY